MVFETQWCQAPEYPPQRTRALRLFSMKSLCDEFARTTSAHGFANLEASSSKTARLFWGFTCCFALVAVVCGIVSVTSKYLLYPTKTSHSLSSAELPFPAVTICNQHPTDFYTVAEIAYDENGHMRWTMGNFSYRGRPGASPFEKDTVDYINAYATFLTYISLSKTYGIYGINTSEYDSWLYTNMLYSRVVQNTNLDTRAGIGGWQARHLITDCTFAGRRCSWRNFTHFVDPAYLSCYTFDPGESGITVPQGPEYGLNLMLFVPHITVLNLSPEAMGHLALAPDLSYGGEGLRISIQEQRAQPFPMSSGIDAPRGHSLSVGVSGTRVIRAFPPYGNCTNTAKHNWDNDYSYSITLCTKVCLQAAIVDKCGCSDFSLPFINRNVTSCQKFPPIPIVCQTVVAMLDNYEHCTDFIMAWFKRNACLKTVTSESETVMSACDCRPQCDEFAYTLSTSLTTWPMYEQTRAVLQTILGNPEFRPLFEPGRYEAYFGNDSYPWVSWEEAMRHTAQGNLLRLGIYVARSSYTQVSVEPLYSLVELLSGYGGQLGLWAGISILTIVEIMMFTYRSIKVVSRNVAIKPAANEATADPDVYSNTNGQAVDKETKF